MARRAQMLALLQLVFLLVVELAHAAPVSDVSSINNIPVDGDGVFSEKHNVTAHTVAPTEDSKAESNHYAATAQDANNMSKEDSMVTKSVNVHTSSEESIEEDVGSVLNSSEDEASGEGSEENMQKNKEVLSVKSANNVDATDGSPVESEGNVDKHEGSPVSESGKNGKTTEKSNAAFEENAGKHEDHSSVENEEVTNTTGTNVTVSEEGVKKNEDTTVTKTGENASSEEPKEHVEDGSITEEASIPEGSEELLKENMVQIVEGKHSSPQDSHVTSSPVGRLSMPSSDDHLKKEEQNSDKDAAKKEDESNPSTEEIADSEAGSPDELIENDRVDSEVLKNDNKTAALGKNMPITKVEEDLRNKNENLQEPTSKISGSPLLTELENTEGKDSVEHQDVNGAQKSTHEKEPKGIDLGGELLGKENEGDNSLGVLTTENPSEDEGSGITPDEIELHLHGKDMSETSSQENHEAEISDRKEGNKDEDAAASEKDGIKSSKDSDGFVDSGSGDEEEHGPLGRMDDVEDGAGSGGNALPGQYDDMASEEHTTVSTTYSHIPIVGDHDESSVEYPSESPAHESSTKTAMFENTDDQNEIGGHFKEENLAQNNTNVQVMSLNPTDVPDVSDNHFVTFDGSGDDDTTTPLAVIVHADIIDDSMEMDLNSSAIGEASHAFQEKPAEKVIIPQLTANPSPPTTEPPCIADEEHDCMLQSNKTVENIRLTNILEDDDEIYPEPKKAVTHTKSTSDENLIELEAVVSTTPAEEESLRESISVEFNKPLLHSNEEISSSTVAPELQEITEPIVDQEAVDNEVMNSSTPDTIVEHPLDETGIKEMSGKIRAANVNELGVSGQENSDDLGEPEALDSSSASGSYVVLGCIMAVVVILLAYAAIKSRRERGTNTNSKKQSEVAGDDDDGTELKDMKKALLPPETPHDERNGDIEANRKPLMDKDENQEEDEKEPIIKQNGTLELSEPPRDIESQVDSSTAENQSKTAPTSNKPQQRNGLSEVVVEKPAVSNGKAESIITHPVAAKVKVIENEDSIAKTPVIINRGGNSPSH